ncbi:MAG TPA: HNH endonuclease [Solirubrobacterales bacterium]|nr:HNH endonuclease [Solirubrobacterales bacterium]
MDDSRLPIPLPVKREVRQRCGFGCVFCGLPLYEYDHLVPYAEVEEHDPENLVLLCATHHREKTSGLLTSDQVDAARKSPCNIEKGETHPYELHYEGKSCEARIGSNSITWPELRDGSAVAGILVDDTPIVGFSVDRGRLLLTVQLLNAENELLVQIVENELILSTVPWDVEFAGRRLTVRHGAGDIFVGMTFEPPSRVVVDRGHLWRNGVQLNVTPSDLHVAGALHMAGCVVSDCSVGVAIGSSQLGGGGIFMPVAQRQAFEPSEETEVRIIRMTTA